MTRKQVSHGYIENDNARKNSLKKRTPSLLKKVEELTILTGIKAGIVVYSPFEDLPAAASFWPSQLEVELLLRQYEAIPNLMKVGRKLDLESYITERVKKLQTQVKYMESSNREMEYGNYLYEICRFGKPITAFLQADIDDLRDYVVERKKALDKRRFPNEVNSGAAIVEQGPVVQQETLIGEDDLSWYMNMMMSGNQAGSSSNNAVSGHGAAMFQGQSDINPAGQTGGSIGDGGLLPHGNSGGVFSELNINQYDWNNIGDYPNPLSVDYQGLGFPMGDINQNLHVGQGLYQGRIEDTNIQGDMHFPDNIDMLSPLPPLPTDLVDFEQLCYDPSSPYYYNVGDNSVENMTQHPKHQ